jgi:hypothetical protein
MWRRVKYYLYTDRDKLLRFQEVEVPNDCIGNQTRDLQARSAVPQSTVPPTLLPWWRQKVFLERRQISTRLHDVTSRRVAQSSCTPQRQSQLSGTKYPNLLFSRLDVWPRRSNTNSEKTRTSRCTVLLGTDLLRFEPRSGHYTYPRSFLCCPIQGTPFLMTYCMKDEQAQPASLLLRRLKGNDLSALWTFPDDVDIRTSQPLCGWHGSVGEVSWWQEMCWQERPVVVRAIVSG